MNEHAIRVMTRGGTMTQDPLYLEGHPKRTGQDSQEINVSAPSASRKKNKNKNDRTLHTSSKPEVERPSPNANDISICDTATQSGSEHLMTHKCRGSIIVLSISKSVEPKEEQKELTSGFQQGILYKH